MPDAAPSPLRAALRRRSEHDRDIVRLAVPAFAALAAEPLYVLADTAVVGRIGTEELGGLAVASALLRAAGLPQSAELPAPPGGCRWPEPPVTFPGYGEPRRTQPTPTEGGEYLESLRSLGYL